MNVCVDESRHGETAAKIDDAVASVAIEHFPTTHGDYAAISDGDVALDGNQRIGGEYLAVAQEQVNPLLRVRRSASNQERED
jgi:hypothetical protein